MRRLSKKQQQSAKARAVQYETKLAYYVVNSALAFLHMHYYSAREKGTAYAKIFCVLAINGVERISQLPNKVIIETAESLGWERPDD